MLRLFSKKPALILAAPLLTIQLLTVPLLALVITAIALPTQGYASNAQTDKKRADKKEETDKFGMSMKKLKALQRKYNCENLVRYREVIPYFGMETTKKVAQQIAVGVERADIKAGRAKLVDVQHNCFPILGNFYVNCTTDVTLCYFKQPQKPKRRVKK